MKKNIEDLQYSLEEIACAVSSEIYDEEYESVDSVERRQDIEIVFNGEAIQVVVEGMVEDPIVETIQAWDYEGECIMENSVITGYRAVCGSDNIVSVIVEEDGEEVVYE